VDLTVIGHLSRDLLITPTLRREALGGGPAYAMLAPAIGCDAGIVTVVGHDFEEEYEAVLHQSGLDMTGFRKTDSVSTRFINEYDINENRTQHIEHLAPPILAKDIMSHLDSKCIHFCPITRIEIEQAAFQMTSDSAALVSLDVQGYSRGVQGELIVPRYWDNASEILEYIDIVKADKAELLTITGVKNLEDARNTLFEMGVDMLVLTKDRGGSTIYTKSEYVKIPLVLSKRAIDTTGCGDTYIIGFLCDYLKSQDIYHAGLFGASCASFNLETIGPYNMPSQDMVLERMKHYL
jgi:sugar/nucleoside kinase (ribokinase family)